MLHTTTCQLERSKVARVEPEQQLLEQVGASVLIVHLHGMLFFGSATSVEEKVRVASSTAVTEAAPDPFGFTLCQHPEIDVARSIKRV